MREYLRGLITRICTAEQTTNSADSVSWHAYREAEGLTDPTMVSEVVEFLNSNPGKNKRQAGYFVLGKLGKNTQDPRCAVSLLSYVPIEKDRYALAGLLDRLAEIRKPIEMNLLPIYKLLADKRWLIRHSAIRALVHAESPQAEDQLLAVLAASTDPDDWVYCHATLNRIGTAKSLSRLQENLGSRNRDVKVSAQAAIDAIRARCAT